MVQLKQSSGVVKSWGVRELYPSGYATGREYPLPGGTPTADGAETFTVLCKQCNFPIEDGQKQDTCPNCGSDNFWGEHYPSTG